MAKTISEHGKSKYVQFINDYARDMESILRMSLYKIGNAIHLEDSMLSSAARSDLATFKVETTESLLFHLLSSN